MWKLCLFAASVAVTWASNSYVVVIPQHFRPGITLNISINILKSTSPVTVTATLTKQNVVSSNTKVYNAGVPDTLQLQVPADLTSGTYTLAVSGSGGLTFTNSTTITYKSKSVSVYIQTDKAIYKPGQTVNFRVFAAYPNLTVYLGPSDINIKDPNGNKIKKWDGLQDSSGVVSNKMIMDTKPVLGDWIIEVTCKDVTEHKVFTVAEYVLPKFEVGVELPSYALSGDTDVTGTVTATYTYGKPVRGTAKIGANIESRPWEIRVNSNQPIVELTVEINGNGTFRIPLADIKRVHSNLNNRNLIVTANVTETLTQISLNGSSSVQFHDDAVEMEFVESNPKNFKPGLKYIAYLKISQPDGRPVTGIRPDVSLTTTVTYNVPNIGTTPMHHFPQTRTYTLPRQTFVVPDSGVVAMEVNVPSNATQINLNAHYGTHQIYKRITKSYSPSDSYMQLFLRSSSVTAGQNAEFELKSTQTFSMATYQVMSRGSIVSAGKILGGYSSTIRFSVPVTSQMAPNARIIVYYVRADGEIVTDSISFDVGGAFQNQVSINFNKPQASPAENVTLAVRADPHSLVSLLAVDQSVLLLKTGNDITQEDVITEIKTYDTIDQKDHFFGGMRPMFGGGDIAVGRKKRMVIFPYPTYYGGSDAAQIFDNAGVKVLTDANIYRHVMPPRFIPMRQMPMREVMFNFGGPMLRSSHAKRFSEVAMAKPDLPLMPPPPANGLKEVTRTRSIFPETWLWSSITTGADGTASITTAIPDTITSWVATAFAVNSQSGLGITANSANIKAFRPFFVSLNLPYSVVRGEQTVLQANVFNYMPQQMTVVVTLESSSGFQSIQVDASGNEQYTSAVQMSTIMVPSGDARSVNFPIVPTGLGKIPITVKAQSTTAADAVRRQLLVEPEGVAKEYNNPVLVDLQQNRPFDSVIPLTLPPNYVSGSQRTRISVIGDIMGPTINGMDKLLQMPTGCGEQTMIGFAPDVFISNYLQATQQMTGDIKEKALNYMEKGYQRELTFQHKDGSFSAFGESDDSGSMWLTAFVVKSFHQAKPHIFIDDNILERAIDWMITKQNSNGSFPEPGRVIHKDMQGESAAGSSLTAFVLIALLENNDLPGSINQRIGSAALNAKTYLETQTVTDVYEQAITSYALTLASSVSADTLFASLNQAAVVQDGMKYWHKTLPTSVHPGHWRPPKQRCQPVDIEMTSYALLIYRQKNDHTGGIPLMKWINTQRNPNGGFCSTQDTVLALQALSEFARMVFSSNTNVQISATAGSLTHLFSVNSQNALLLQSIEMQSVPAQVVVSATGNGMALLEVAVYFNVEEEIEETSFALNVRLSDETINSMKVQTCMRWLKSGSSGMAVQEFGVPSGFEVDIDSIGSIANLKRVEFEDRKVVLYFDEIGSIEQCISFGINRVGMVAKSQPAVVRIYDYYEPANQVTGFYQSQLLRNATICDVCDACGCV